MVELITGQGREERERERKGGILELEDLLDPEYYNGKPLCHIATLGNTLSSCG
jgi:hypothetical protein